MSNCDLVVVEIIYKDATSKGLKSIIGRVNQYEIDYFNDHESNFIMPSGHTESPISKDAITEIIIYRKSDTFPCHKGKLIRNHQIARRKSASISY